MLSSRFSGSSCAGSSRFSLFQRHFRGILSVGNAPSVRLFGYPALVADVGVTAGRVHRRDDAPSFRRRVVGHGQPRAGVPVLIDVLGRRFNAHVRQPGALKVETGQLFAGHLEPVRFPVGVYSLLRLGGFFAPPFRVVEHLASWRLNRLTRLVRGINNTRIRFQAVARAHIGIMPSFRNRPTSVSKDGRAKDAGGDVVEFMS
jgi:hypothetical protein